jgi:NAD+ diphosphatase
MQKKSIYTRYEPAVASENRRLDHGYCFVFSGSRLLVETDTSGIRIPMITGLQKLDLSPENAHYLGYLEGEPCYTVSVPKDACEPDGMAFQEFKTLFSVLDHDISMLAGRASQIIGWDKTHRFCGRCGSPTVELPGERAKKCPECGFISFPRISPAVITAVIKEDKILLAHARNYHGDVHSLIAGFLEPGETLEECVRREIMEEVGLKVKNIRYYGSQPWPFPNSMMVGFIAEYESGEICVDGNEIEKAGWFDANHLPELPGKISIAYDIIQWYIKTYPQK